MEALKTAAESVPLLQKEIDDLKRVLEDKTIELNDRENDSDILKNLFDLGLIDGEGNPIYRD